MHNNNDSKKINSSYKGYNDVYCARGNGVNTYPGNQLYRRLINDHKGHYRKLSKNRGKRNVARKIMNEIVTRGGRFLIKVDPTKNEWEPILSQVKVLDKIMQALRERKQRESPNILEEKMSPQGGKKRKQNAHKVAAPPSYQETTGDNKETPNNITSKSQADCELNCANMNHATLHDHTMTYSSSTDAISNHNHKMLPPAHSEVTPMRLLSKGSPMTSSTRSVYDKLIRSLAEEGQEGTCDASFTSGTVTLGDDVTNQHGTERD
jgi:hypothetical protein